MASPAIKTWEDADAALRALGDAQMDKQAIEAAMNEEINKVKAKFASRAERAQTAIDMIEPALEKFWRHEHGHETSRQLTFGTIGQIAGKLSVHLMSGWKLDQVIAALKAGKMTQFIRTKEELRKPEIIAVAKALSLENCGIAVKPGKTTFYAEPDLSKIRAAGKDAA